MLAYVTNLVAVWNPGQILAAASASIYNVGGGTLQILESI